MPISTTINNPTIFTGGDTKFWNRFGKSFVNSFKYYNPNLTIHVHIFDPTEDDIKELESLPCNYSVEYTDQNEILEFVKEAYSALEDPSTNNEHKWNVKKCLKFFDDIPDMDGKLLKLMRFTKFASTRFIRLSEMWTGEHPVLAYDMDTICQGKIPLGEIFKISDQGCLKTKSGFVVSLVSFQKNSQFVKEWAGMLIDAFNKKQVYGYLDQDSFIKLTEKYCVAEIDRLYCDYTPKYKNSLVLTGKGSMKESEVFLNLVKHWNEHGKS